MSRSTLWSLEAESDLIDAADWYRSIAPGLGLRFLNQVSDSIARIEFMPEMFAKVRGDLRRVRVRRFPYGVFYRVFNDRIEIIAVMHNRRNPTVWQSR